MNLARHYRTLELHRGASSREVKAAYRKLVRQYHPDINPDKAAIEQFIKINDAYTALSEALPADSDASTHAKRPAPSHFQGGDRLERRLNNLRQTLEKLGLGTFNAEQSTEPAYPSAYSSGAIAEPFMTVSVSQPLHRNEASTTVRTDVRIDDAAARPLTAQRSAPLSMQEESLKQEAYQQLKDLLRQQKFPRATALVEGLAHRLPKDSEIIQWQAIVYQRWGRRLIDEGQPQKARIYLKKALRTDPNNPSLWREINHDFWQLANLGAPSGAVL